MKNCNELRDVLKDLLPDTSDLIINQVINTCAHYFGKEFMKLWSKCDKKEKSCD